MYDVIIIGAGAGGLPIFHKLFKAGLNVLLIDQGSFLDKAQIFPISLGGELQRYTTLNVNPNIRDLKSDIPIDCSSSQIALANYSGIGGSTVLFSSQYLRFKPYDFKISSQFGCGYDWPLSYDDLLPFYKENELNTGLAGLAGDPHYPDIKPNMPPVLLGDLGRTLARGFNKLDWHWWPAYSALNTIPHLGRPSDTYHRPTNLADITGSKGSSNNVYLSSFDADFKAKRLSVLENCRVLSLSADSRSTRIQYVRCVDLKTKKYFTLKSKLFVLSAGSVYSPQLLLNSTSPDYPRGISNSSGQVGRNLMIHPLGYAEGLYSENLNSCFGPQGCCLYSHQFYKNNRSNKFLLGYTFQSIRGPLPIESSISWLRRRYLKSSDSFANSLLSLFNHTSHLTVITHDLPEASNFVSLSKQVDQFNSLIPSVSYSLSDNTKNMLSHGLDNARRVLYASGAKKTFVSGPVRETGWHALGTCRMGLEPNQSVVNQFCRSHDHPNLFIVDGSVFPSSSGVNPCNTIQSLSLYVGEHIIRHKSSYFS